MLFSRASWWILGSYPQVVALGYYARQIRRAWAVGRIFLLAAALLAGLGVALGAFGAHALRSQLDSNALAIFETAVRYQMYHALALALVALLIDRPSPPPTLRVSGYSFMIGTVLFSGSLYALSLTGIKVLGAVTPLGGVAYLVGWICLALAAWSLKS